MLEKLSKISMLKYRLISQITLLINVLINYPGISRLKGVENQC